MGRAQARPPFTLYCHRPPGAASGQPRPTGRQAASRTPLLSIVTGRREQHQDSRGPQDARLLVGRLSSADLLHRRPQRLAQRT